MGENLRLFVAMDLPSRVKSEIGEIMVSLVERYPGVRWVKAENLHLTLKFLGHVESSKVGGLCSALEEVCSEARPFRLRVSGCGAFPHQGRGRVFWLGLGGEVNEAVELAGRIDRKLEGLDFAREERPFRPHVTLGRMKRPMPCQDLVEDWTVFLQKIGTMEFEVVEAVLFQSILRKEGPTYLPLKAFSFKGV